MQFSNIEMSGTVYSMILILSLYGEAFTLVLMKAKCNQVHQNHERQQSCDYFNVFCFTREIKNTSDKNIRCLCTNEETETFLKLIHETNVYVVFPSHFVHLRFIWHHLSGNVHSLTFSFADFLELWLHTI